MGDNDFTLGINLEPEVDKEKLKEEKNKINEEFKKIVELNVGFSESTNKSIKTFKKQFLEQMKTLGSTFDFKDIRIAEGLDKQLESITAKYKNKMGGIVSSIYTPERNKKGKVLTSKSLEEVNKTLVSSEEQRLKIEQAQTKEKIAQAKLTEQEIALLNRANNAATNLKKSAIGLRTPEAKEGGKQSSEIKNLIKDVTSPESAGRSAEETAAKFERIKILTSDINKNITATKAQSKAVVAENEKLLRIAERRQQAENQVALSLKKTSGFTAPSLSAVQSKAGEITSLTSRMGSMTLKEQEASLLRLNTLQKELNGLLGITHKEQRDINAEIKKDVNTREKAVQNAKEFLEASKKYERTQKLSETENIANKIISLESSTKGMSPDRVRHTTEEIKRLNGSLNENQKGFKVAGHDALSFTEKLKAGITHLIAYRIGSQALYASVQELKNAITYIKDLDKEMTNIQVVTGGTREEMAQLAQGYNDLGREMSASTIDIAKGVH